MKKLLKNGRLFCNSRYREALLHRWLDLNTSAAGRSMMQIATTAGAICHCFLHFFVIVFHCFPLCFAVCFTDFHCFHWHSHVHDGFCQKYHHCEHGKGGQGSPSCLTMNESNTLSNRVGRMFSEAFTYGKESNGIQIALGTEVR